MTPSELKYKLEWAGHESNFFSHQTMRFFGDTIQITASVRPSSKPETARRSNAGSFGAKGLLSMA